MSGYKNFAVLGAGNIGKFIIDELLRSKAAGTISSVVIVSRSVSQKIMCPNNPSNSLHLTGRRHS